MWQGAEMGIMKDANIKKTESLPSGQISPEGADVTPITWYIPEVLNTKAQHGKLKGWSAGKKSLAMGECELSQWKQVLWVPDEVSTHPRAKSSTEAHAFPFYY